jgi:hypothetical protein
VGQQEISDTFVGVDFIFDAREAVAFRDCLSGEAVACNENCMNFTMLTDGTWNAVGPASGQCFETPPQSHAASRVHPRKGVHNGSRKQD